MRKILRCFVFASALAQLALFSAAANAQTPAPLFNWGTDPASQYWSVYIGGISATRSTPSSSVVATPPTGTPGVLINANSFDNFDWKTVPEFVVQRRFDGGWMVEGRYFNLGTVNDHNQNPNVTTFRIAGIGVTILGGGTLDNTYASSLKSFELNLYKQLTSGFSVLAGYRSFRFDDHLHVGLVGTGLNISDWNDRNQLNGAQIGVSLNLMSPGVPLLFNVTAKTGWYHNSIDHDFTSQIVSRASDNGSRTAQVTELNATATYQVTNNFALRGGYMVVWLNRVGLAGEAANSTIQQPGGTASPIATGNAWYQGATFGAVITF